MFKKLFTEALRVVSKGDKRDAHTVKVHKGEIDHAKKEMDPLQVGYIGDIKIMKSKHATEIRDQDSFSRDYNMDNDMFLSVFRKLFMKRTFKPNQKTSVVYRNKKRKFDVMVVELRGKTLTIITVIKKGERAPYDAKQSSREGQVNIIVEKIKHTIENEIIIY